MTQLPLRRSALIMADIEGIAGVHDKRQCKPYSPQWRAARELITADVNAAVSGLQAAGVSDIVVRDMHGTGYNILARELPRGVRCLQGQFWKPVPLLGDLPAADCAVMIGWHAGPDQPEGFSPHIFHREIRRLRINDAPVTEVELFAAVLGELGIPVNFLSADQVAIDRIVKSLPWIKTLAIPKEPLEAQELGRMQQKIKSSVRESLSEVQAVPFLLGAHAVELTTPGGTSTWQSPCARETLAAVLRKTIFKGVPAPLLPAMLCSYRLRSRYRNRKG